MEELFNKITITNERNIHKSGVSTNNVITFGLSYDELNIDEIKNKLYLELNGGITEGNIKTLVRQYNSNIINNNEFELYDLVVDKKITYTKNQITDYLKINNIEPDIISNVTNFVKFSFSPKVLMILGGMIFEDYV